MTEISINMPQMAVIGLSENWLFRYSGDRHWQALCESLGTPSHELMDSEGNRLYPSFVAIRTRYSIPSSAVVENETFEVGTTLSRYGNAIFTSENMFHNKRCRLHIEMVTKFVARRFEGQNKLRNSSLRPEVISSAPEQDLPHPLLKSFQMMKSCTTKSYAVNSKEIFDDPKFQPQVNIVVNPYIEFNGAGLLYFASYPTIADQVERLLVNEHELGLGDRDWAFAAGTVARDIFYFGNLDVGEDICGTMKSFALDNDSTHGRIVKIHTSLANAGSGAVLAEIYTIKSLDHE